MKNIFCLYLLSISFLGFTQIREKGNIELTPIVGYSISYHTYSFFFHSSPISEFQIGVYGNYYFNNRWSLRSGVLYQKMGAKEVSFLIFNNNYSEKTSYLTVPLTVSFHFGETRDWYINYGIGLGTLLSAKANENNGKGYIDIMDVTNKFQIGLIGGIGYKLKISSNLAITFEYNNMFGLSNTTKVQKTKNLYISFNAGLAFRI